MGTALLVITNIAQTQKWASGSDPTLLFEKRTERMYVYKCNAPLNPDTEIRGHFNE